jgi:hypothetical protein
VGYYPNPIKETIYPPSFVKRGWGRLPKKMLLYNTKLKKCSQELRKNMTPILSFPLAGNPSLMQRDCYGQN